MGLSFLICETGGHWPSMSRSERVCPAVPERRRGCPHSQSRNWSFTNLTSLIHQTYPSCRRPITACINAQCGLRAGFPHLTRALFAPPGVWDAPHPRTLEMETDMEMGKRWALASSSPFPSPRPWPLPRSLYKMHAQSSVAGTPPPGLARSPPAPADRTQPWGWGGGLPKVFHGAQSDGGREGRR